MSQSYTCRGCLRPGFTQSGLIQHQRLSKNTACHAEFEHADNYLPVKLVARAPTGEAVMDPAPSAPILEFQGDYFGSAADYHDDPFGQDKAGEDDESEVDDDEGISSERSTSKDEESEREDPWEPVLPPFNPQVAGLDSEDVDIEEEYDTCHAQAEARLRAEGIFIDRYPSSLAGKPVDRDLTSDELYAHKLGARKQRWAPFSSRRDWEVTRWAKLHVGATAWNEFLAIHGVPLALGLSYKTVGEMNAIIDHGIPGRP
ncbi:hypothetical protein FISHEDRAFT_60355 [Fistulina hepatica ATCC 64428]|uniref:Uncharacterized protein n=1 Tax=Fistulina hepatica ATCC 64428 TaxID=1128425 RepID=A0A0D7A938_9AGAR|nr:hypothetical protein FISHEDRAFT_60355 [Fistulina hepatica ATCC 64428]